MSIVICDDSSLKTHAPSAAQLQGFMRYAPHICDCKHDRADHVFAGGCRVRPDGKLCKCSGFSRVKSAPPRCVPPGSVVQGVFNVGQTVAHRSGYIGEVVAVKGEHITVAFDDEQPDKPQEETTEIEDAPPEEEVVSASLSIWPDCPLVKRLVTVKKSRAKKTAVVKRTRVILASALVAPCAEPVTDAYAHVASA